LNDFLGREALEKKSKERIEECDLWPDGDEDARMI